MQIFGNPRNSNKFYVYLDDGSIIWTSKFETARRYVENQRYENWYNKPLYCTNEDIVVGYDGKLYVKSKCPEDPTKSVITYDNKTLFLKNAKNYIDKALEDLFQELPFDNLFELYTYKDSKIKEYKQLCKDVLEYRDNMHLFTQKIIKKYKNRLTETNEIVDLSDIYDDYLTNFPKFKQKDTSDE